MRDQKGNIAIAEPPARVAPPRDARVEREPVQASELAMLRDRVRRMRLPRGEMLPRTHR